MSGFWGSIGGGILSSLGQGSANKQNEMNMIQDENWKKMMSDTAHTREVADLKNAGLNPILSMGGTGASTPSSGMAVAQNANEGLATAAKEAFAFKQAQQKQNAEVEAIDQSVKTASSQERKNDADAKAAKASEDSIRAGIPKITAESKIYEQLSTAAGNIENNFKGLLGFPAQGIDLLRQRLEESTAKGRAWDQEQKSKEHLKQQKFLEKYYGKDPIPGRKP